MAQKPDGKQKGNDRVTFTRAAADRIASVVLEVEGGGRDTGPLEFGFRGGAVGGKTFRVCTFTGSWPIGTSKAITLNNQASTISAVNVFLGMNPTSATDCCVVRDGTAWYCVSADLTKQPGYSSVGTHVLTIQNGSVAWVGTTTC